MNAITLKALFCISGVAVGGLLLFSSFETKATERWGIGSALVAESVEVALTRELRRWIWKILELKR